MELKESVESFEDIANQSLIGTIIIQDDIIKYVNKKMADMLGYSAEEILKWKPKEFYVVVGPESIEIAQDQIPKKQYGLSGTKYHNVVQMKKKSGELYWADSFGKTIEYQQRPANLVYQVDITGRLKNEKEIKKSEENYRKAFQESNLCKDLIIHDVNNILSVIKMSAELLSEVLKTPGSSDYYDLYINLIQESITKGIQLISKIRKLSKVERSKNQYLKQIELYPILNQAIDFTKKWVIKNLEITIQPKEVKYIVKANEFLFEVFENILNNAVKYNDNSKVEILIKISQLEEENEEFVKIEFKDNGIGISDDRKNIIFEHGFEAYKGGKGLGIGLSLVKKILEQFNGKIRIENRLNEDYTKGSNFIIFLPII